VGRAALRLLGAILPPGCHQFSEVLARAPLVLIFLRLLYSLSFHALKSSHSFVLVMIATALIAAVNGKHFLFPVSRAPILEIVGLNTISVLVILGANVFLFIFIPRLSAFERHQNKSQQEETIMLRLYFFQVFNTVVASLILWDATQNSAGKADWPHWFADGGYFLFSVMIGDALLMNSIEYFRPFDMLIPRYITGRKVVTQQRLNRLYSLPTFSLGMRFQFVLKSATIALLFGSALPILKFVSATTLLLTYASDKYLVSAFRLETVSTRLNVS
jgi:Calcium-dependent channel, 7TM region, putative phosphate